MCVRDSNNRPRSLVDSLTMRGSFCFCRFRTSSRWATSAWFDSFLVEFGTPSVPFPTPDSPVVVLLRARLLVESTDAGGPCKPHFHRTTCCPHSSLAIQLAYIRVRCSCKLGQDWDGPLQDDPSDGEAAGAFLSSEPIARHVTSRRLFFDVRPFVVRFRRSSRRYAQQTFPCGGSNPGRSGEGRVS